MPQLARPLLRKRPKSAPPKAGVKRVAAKGRGSLLKVARAVDALRQGRPVSVGGWSVVAAETLDDKAPVARGFLVLTHARARTLKIRLYTQDVVALPLRIGMDAAYLHAVADPTADLATPLKGPFEAVRRELPAQFAAAVKLAKLAGLLPAVILRKQNKSRGAVDVSVQEILSYESESANSLKLVTRARVPLEGAENAELAAFRAGDGAPENYAILINRPPTPGPVLVRLHSECFTGDLLGSLKCDCGAQLRGAVETISKEGGGVLLYLAQEGRGIGLINKLRAYRLQDEGFDTLEANERLGFKADERLYAVAAKMLSLLGYKSVRLLTNNPAKVSALQTAGVKVVERVRHAFPGNKHNEAYLKTKVEKAGHLF